MISRAAAVAVTVLLLTAGACGGDDDSAPTTTADPTTTAPSTEPTTTEPLTDEEAITQLEEDWWQALREMSAGERDVEDASQYLGGDYLELFLEERSGDPGNLILSDSSSIQVGHVVIDDLQGTVDLCIVDADFVPAGDETVWTRRFRDTVDAASGDWRIVRRERIGEAVEGMSCDE